MKATPPSALALTVNMSVPTASEIVFVSSAALPALSTLAARASRSTSIVRSGLRGMTCS